MLTTKQRAYLKSLAHHKDSVFQIGKNSLTPEITKAVNDYLEVHELIKVSVLNNCETDIREIAEALGDRTHSQVVQIIGKKIVLYRQSTEKPVIELPKVSKNNNMQ